MIELTRLNGEKIMINPDHLRFVGSCPDTLLTFTDGKTLLVKESPAQVSDMFMSFRDPHRRTAIRPEEDACK
ncbi:MAG: flagellar FlbD family protein [Bdellovibrionales bacterium]